MLSFNLFEWEYICTLFEKSCENDIFCKTISLALRVLNIIEFTLVWVQLKLFNSRLHWSVTLNVKSVIHSTLFFLYKIFLLCYYYLIILSQYIIVSSVSFKIINISQCQLIINSFFQKSEEPQSLTLKSLILFSPPPLF